MGGGRLSRAALPALLLAVALTLLQPGTAGAQLQGEAELPTLRWLVQDLPPHFGYAVKGRLPQRAEDLDGGEISGFLRLLIERLPQYRHEFFEASLPRFEALVRQGDGTLCSVLHLRTPERLAWLHFTELHPPLISRQLHVIVHRERLAAFESQPGQALQLAELIRRPDLVGLLPRDRSFGPRIDALLQAAGAQAPATVVAGRQMHLLAMLRARRMDYTLEYPAVVDRYLLSGEAAAGELVKLPFAEGRSTAVATAACSRNAAGRERIAAIDSAVRGLALDPRREAWLRQWRGPVLDEAERRSILRYMDERARGGPRVE